MDVAVRVDGRGHAHSNAHICLHGRVIAGGALRISGQLVGRSVGRPVGRGEYIIMG